MNVRVYSVYVLKHSNCEIEFRKTWQIVYERLQARSGRMRKIYI